MSKQPHSTSTKPKRYNWWQIALVVVGAFAFILGGGFLYNEVYKKPVLTYTILPAQDLGDRAFTVVIENRGGVPLTDVQILLSDLDAPLEALNMPGDHEPAQLVRGGVGQREALIAMPRLSRGGSLSIYMLASGAVKLEEGETLFISSKETTGVARATRSTGVLSQSTLILMLIAYIAGMITAMILLSPRIYRI